MDPDGSTMKSLLASLNRYRYSSSFDLCSCERGNSVSYHSTLLGHRIILTSTGPVVWVEEPPTFGV